MSAMPAFEDWLEIANLKARYCRCLDTKDWGGYAAVFTDDLVLDATGSGGPLIEGREAAVASVRASIGAARTVHQVHAPEIEIDGDRATGIWAMQDRLSWPDGRTLFGHGHYHEDYVRRDGRWLIRRSRLTRLMLEMSPPVA